MDVSPGRWYYYLNMLFLVGESHALVRILGLISDENLCILLHQMGKEHFVWWLFKKGQFEVADEVPWLGKVMNLDVYSRIDSTSSDDLAYNLFNV